MQHYSILGTCLKWFQNYLDNRLQFTALGNHVSIKVPNGVPQGSVLGPILYLIYVNDIQSCNLSSKVMFANKTAVANKIAVIMYKKMVFPFLEFGNIFFLNCNEGDLIRIWSTQNRCLRQILGKDNRYSTFLLHKDTRLASWRSRALTASMKLLFKLNLSQNAL